MDHVTRWLEKHSGGDSPLMLLALQETKVSDDKFPREVFTDMGWDVYLCGQKAYHGVAILSRLPVRRICTVEDFSFPPNLKGMVEARAIEVELDNGLCVMNVYCVNGEALDSPKFPYKLDWFEVLISHLETMSENRSAVPHIVMGDFNIAPSDLDVYDAKIWRNRIHVSDTERELLTRIEDVGYVDIYRHLYPNRKDFSWWDYRTGAYDKNQGLRIDLTYGNQASLATIVDASIDDIPRGWQTPSDHTPVLVSLQ